MPCFSARPSHRGTRQTQASSGTSLSGGRASRPAHMRASLASNPGEATIRDVAPDPSIADKPLGRRSHRFTIRGMVDIDSAREPEQRLRDVVLGGKSTVIVDLTDVAELGSSLVGVLIRTQRSLNWRN